MPKSNRDNDAQEAVEDDKVDQAALELNRLLLRPQLPQ